MNESASAFVPQITVLDSGGQYCHLIARKVRELGVSAEVLPCETAADRLKGRKGVILSGGPSSVYDPGSPHVDPAIFGADSPVLGICYGLHLMAHLLGGSVQPGDKGEFGMATLEINCSEAPLFAGLSERERIWMSHRDTVIAVPPGFAVLGKTDTCPVAAMAEPQRKLYGIQFHPEVVHTAHGTEILSNFLFGVCDCEKDWDPEHRIPAIEEEIRRVAGDRNVFFFVSGGVDSTVAFTLCLRALGPKRVRGVYVDTGLMREGETEFVRGVFERLGAGVVAIEPAQREFLGALAGIGDPERKRIVIGEQFLRVQERIIETRHLLDGHWILGQGTIYPDTIESGGTEKAALIKTHHNRVAGVQELIQAGRIVEPLHSFYKDEVRKIGRQLDLPADLLDRHPFPGPGLAIRCLCAERNEPVVAVEDGFQVPIRSVGVQGDSRSYAPILAVERFPSPDSRLREWATETINRVRGINRIVALVGARAPLNAMSVHASALSPERLSRLRSADAIVRRMSHAAGFDRNVWQFPVVLIPLGSADAPDSVVLRPIDSVDGMTAQSVLMEEPLLRRLAAELLEIAGVCAVLYDLTHKPPATIEWE
ncbi:MAG: glutamine-hydrolyzing GMP synthase [Bryobacteraceae bacterium]